MDPDVDVTDDADEVALARPLDGGCSDARGCGRLLEPPAVLDLCELLGRDVVVDLLDRPAPAIGVEAPDRPELAACDRSVAQSPVGAQVERRQQATDVPPVERGGQATSRL
jgi:hypothetical protein